MNGRYADYLQSDEWKSFANDLKKRRGNRCECCGSPEGLQVHHMRYTEDLKEEADLFVLCESCHKCFHRCIDRFRKQVNVSALMQIDVQKDLLRRSVLDLYQNSLYKAATQAEINAFSPVGYCTVRDMLILQIELKFPEIEVINESGSIQDCIRVVTLEDSGVIAWRNAAILAALQEGIPDYTIQKRFRLSENTYYKIKRSVK